MDNDAISISDERQPYHVIDGKILTQIEWKQKFKLATEVFEAFKHQAYLDGSI
jgi:hypothetical protein